MLLIYSKKTLLDFSFAQQWYREDYNGSVRRALMLKIGEKILLDRLSLFILALEQSAAEAYNEIQPLPKDRWEATHDAAVHHI